MDVHPTKNVSIGIDPHPYVFCSVGVNHNPRTIPASYQAVPRLIGGILLIIALGAAGDQRGSMMGIHGD